MCLKRKAGVELRCCGGESTVVVRRSNVCVHIGILEYEINVKAATDAVEHALFFFGCVWGGVSDVICSAHSRSINVIYTHTHTHPRARARRDNVQCARSAAWVENVKILMISITNIIRKGGSDNNTQKTKINNSYIFCPLLRRAPDDVILLANVSKKKTIYLLPTLDDSDGVPSFIVFWGAWPHQGHRMNYITGGIVSYQSPVFVRSALLDKYGKYPSANDRCRASPPVLLLVCMNHDSMLAMFCAHAYPSSQPEDMLYGGLLTSALSKASMVCFHNVSSPATRSNIRFFFKGCLSKRESPAVT